MKWPPHLDDPDEIAALWYEAYRLTFRFARKILREYQVFDESPALNIASDKSTRVVTLMKNDHRKFPSKQSFKSYLYRAAQNAVKDLKRKKTPRASSDGPDPVAPPGDWSPAFWRSCEKLPAEDRIILELYYVHGMTDGDLGAFYGKKDNQWFRRKKRLPALERLRRILDDDDCPIPEEFRDSADNTSDVDHDDNAGGAK